MLCSRGSGGISSGKKFLKIAHLGLTLEQNLRPKLDDFKTKALADLHADDYEIK